MELIGFEVRIYHSGRWRYLGYYDTFDDAVSDLRDFYGLYDIKDVKILSVYK